MITLQDCKYVLLTPPAAIIDDAAVTVASLDTNNFEYAQIIVILGATDIALTACKVGESDTDGSYVDVTGLVSGTSLNIAGATSTLMSATDDNKFYVFDIDLTKRKRYLKGAVTVGNGTAGGYVTVIAILSRSKLACVTAAQRGALEILRA